MKHASLPIDDVLSALHSALAQHHCAVLEAPPGAGKTTRVPLALRDAEWLNGKRIVMLEPRRLATRAAAHFMAASLGEPVGQTVGYRMRGETRVSARTRIEVVTEGVLTRLLADDQSLDAYGAVLFDEFHERSLHADIGLALTLETQQHLRPDLRVLIMSATLDSDTIARLLRRDDQSAPVVRSDGRMFPVETVYREPRGEERVDATVSRTVREALDAHAGDMLVFLPGMSEQRRVADRLHGDATVSAHCAVVHVLHGSLPFAEQVQAIAPAPNGARKIVLATSIAETSLTIEGVRIVVDSGLSRLPRFDARAGLTRLSTVRVSRASADQRRGRAGRVAPGVCYRLWHAADDHTLMPRTRPEMLDADLSSLALELANVGVHDVTTLRWLDTPPAGAVVQARELLTQLGALDTNGRITPHGRAMSALPMAPRLAHLLLGARARGLHDVGTAMVALLEERETLRVDNTATQVDIRLRINDGGHAGVLLALGFPDRVAQRRPGSEPRYVLRSGTGAALARTDALSTAPYLAIAELDGAPPEYRIARAAPISIEELRDVFASDIVIDTHVEWHDASRSVRAYRRSMLGALVLDEHITRDVDGTRVTEMLLAQITREGVDALPIGDAARRTRERLAFVHAHDNTWPDVSSTALTVSMHEWLAPHLDGVRSCSQLESLPWNDVLLSLVPWEQRRAFERLAPTHVDVPSGSRIALDYSDPQAPVLAVKLQEVFGWSTTPMLFDGRVPITLHLLSPAQRPVQVTRDLAGFWRSSYFDVRRELRGRYPRHPWPEDPLTATATRRAKPRGT